MFQKIAKHRANDASHDVHRTPLGWGWGGGQPNLGNAWILGMNGTATHPLQDNLI